MLRIHHLVCGTMRPLGVVPLVCHVLLLEHDDGLALVDTGYGTPDLARPSRLGTSRWTTGVRLDPGLTAVRQVERLGFAASDVRDVVLTHMDYDHVGGLVDLPDALVHTTADELAATSAPASERRGSYRTATLQHRPRMRTYDGPGEPWRDGLTAHPVEGLDGVHLVPMPGHTRGHAVVAVDLPGGGLLVHAGDAAFDASVYRSRTRDGRRLRPRRVLRLAERAIGEDRAALGRNHEALARLASHQDVEVVTAHDPRTFAPPRR